MTLPSKRLLAAFKAPARLLGGLISRFDAYDIVFFLIVAGALLLRLSAFQYGFLTTEAHRDYLVAHHIFQYGELVGQGPTTSYGFPNSPAYYYLLVPFLLVNDSFLGLALSNIALQVVTLVFVYILTKLMFGGRAALLATLIFATSRELLRQSEYMWQPYLANPFLYASYLLLLLAYMKKRFAALLAGIALFLLAAALHLSVLFMAPFLAAIAILIIKKHRWGLAHALILVLTVLNGAALLWGGAITQTRNGTTLLAEAFFKGGFPRAVENMTGALQSLFALLAPNGGEGFYAQNTDYLVSLFPSFRLLAQQNWESASLLAFFLLAAAAIGLYLLVFQDARRRPYALALLGVVLGHLLLLSLLSRLPSYYLIAVYGLVIILLAAGLDFLSRRSVALKIFMVFLLVFVLFGSLPLKMASSGARSSFTNLTWTPQPVQAQLRALEAEIASIREEEGREDWRFFQFRVYRYGRKDAPIIDAPYWAHLESITGMRFVRNKDSVRWFSYESLNADDHLFVACQLFPDERECLERFFSQNPKYRIEKELYRDRQTVLFAAARTP